MGGLPLFCLLGGLGGGGVCPCFLFKKWTSSMSPVMISLCPLRVRLQECNEVTIDYHSAVFVFILYESHFESASLSLEMLDDE